MSKFKSMRTKGRLYNFLVRKNDLVVVAVMKSAMKVPLT